MGRTVPRPPPGVIVRVDDCEWCHRYRQVSVEGLCDACEDKARAGFWKPSSRSTFGEWLRWFFFGTEPTPPVIGTRRGFRFSEMPPPPPPPPMHGIRTDIDEINETLAPTNNKGTR